MFKKSINNEPTIGTIKNAILESTYFSVTEFIFAIAFDVDPIEKPVKPETITAES